MGFEKDASSSSHALPREDTPLIGQPQPLSSQFKTFANVFISVVGSGVLGLPYTFKKTGWALGTLMIFSVAAITYYCMMLLISTRRKLESSQGLSKIASFGDVGFAVSGPIGRLAVDAMIVLSQAGFCAAYLLFIADTVAFMVNAPSPAHPDPRIWGMTPKSVYIWTCFPFQLGLNSIPTLTHLAPLSIFADIVDIGAMGVVMAEEAAIASQQRPAVGAFGGPSVFLYGLGVAVYAFEGIGMVLPLESEAKDRGKFGKILGVSMVFISFMYGGFGAVGYFAFGDETKDIVTTNLGKGVVSYGVQAGLCVNLFFTFPLMMNPVYEVGERWVCDGRYCVWLRWAAVLVVSLVALWVPNFADFMSLVGSTVCCLLGFVLPASFHWVVFRGGMGWRGALADASIALLGLLVAISGTWISLSQTFASKSRVK